MPRDRREAFKIGVLLKCAEAGLTPEETTAFAKEATEQLRKQGSMPWEPLNQLTQGAINIGEKAITGYALPGLAAAAILGPPAVGYAAGRAVAAGTDVDDEDVKTMKKRELIEMYRAQARRLQDRR